jgi:hypothetical protein
MSQAQDQKYLQAAANTMISHLSSAMAKTNILLNIPHGLVVSRRPPILGLTHRSTQRIEAEDLLSFNQE